MKRLKYLLVGFVLIGVPMLLSWAVVAHAQSFRSGDNVTVAVGQTVNSTLYSGGKSIDISGTVNGDVFCAGQNVTISGDVHGDVICAGQSVSVSGTVSGDVRLAGQNITLGGHISGNASLAGQTLIVESSANIGGDLGAAGQDVTLNGPVGRDLSVGGQTVVINNHIGRDIQANVQQLTLQSGAVVRGSIAYTSNNDLTRSKDALVSGSVTRSAPKQHQTRPGAIVAVGFGFALYMFVAVLLLALVMVLLIPRALHVATEGARRNLGKTFLVGFVSSILVPVGLVALMFTVVGIPLALFAGLVWLVGVLLSGPFAAYLTGRLLLQNTKVDNAVWTMLLGTAVLLVLYLVPFLGALVAMLAVWFGLGTILLRLSRHYPNPHYHMAPETAAVAAEDAKKHNK